MRVEAWPPDGGVAATAADVATVTTRADVAGTETAAVSRPERVRILGSPADAVTMDGAVAVVERAVAGGGRCRILVTNANKAWLARRDARLRAILEAAELVVPEWATVWAARRLRRPTLHHVGGFTLMVRLLDEAERRGWSTYYLGATAEVVDRLVARLRRERPKLRIVGHHHGYLDAALDRSVRREIAAARPELLFVAMGSPLQEYWIDDAWPELGASVALGVGGSFDVLAGVKADAPAWARGRGLEWLHRLAQDPRRYWRRYLVTNAWFVGAVLAERVREVRRWR
ncbi:MAG TPA: WecB/TagA/CpsF family glycosyltransferase [Longimicrobiales bacterium]